MLNIYDILQEQLLNESRESKIFDKLKKTIKRCNPNVSDSVWNELVPTTTGGEQRKIELEAHNFIHKFFNTDATDRHIMELIPHTAEIAYGELDYLTDHNSEKNNDFRDAMKIIIESFKEHESQFEEDLENFKKADFNKLWSMYGGQVELHRETDAEKTNEIVDDDNLNGYTVHAIDTYEESKEFNQYCYKDSKWCLTYLPEYYFEDYYTDYCKNRVYFITHEGFEDIEATLGEEPDWKVPHKGNPPYDKYGYSMISIIVRPDGSIENCCSRYNHAYGDADRFLTENEVTQLLQKDYHKVLVPYDEDELEEREEYYDDYHNDYDDEEEEDDEERFDRIAEYVDRAVENNSIDLGCRFALEPIIDDCLGDIVYDNWDAESEDDIDLNIDDYRVICRGEPYRPLETCTFGADSVKEDLGTNCLAVMLEDYSNDLFWLYSYDGRNGYFGQNNTYCFGVADYIVFDGKALIVSEDGEVFYFYDYNSNEFAQLYDNDGDSFDLGTVYREDVAMYENGAIGHAFIEIDYKGEGDEKIGRGMSHTLFKVEQSSLKIIIENDAPIEGSSFVLSDDGKIHCQNGEYEITEFERQWVFNQKLNNQISLYNNGTGNKNIIYDTINNHQVGETYTNIRYLDYGNFKVRSSDGYFNILHYDFATEESYYLCDEFVNNVSLDSQDRYFIVDTARNDDTDTFRYYIIDLNGEVLSPKFSVVAKYHDYDQGRHMFMVNANGNINYYDNVYNVQTKEFLFPKENTNRVFSIMGLWHNYHDIKGYAVRTDDSEKILYDVYDLSGRLMWQSVCDINKDSHILIVSHEPRGRSEIYNVNNPYNSLYSVQKYVIHRFYLLFIPVNENNWKILDLEHSKLVGNPNGYPQDNVILFHYSHYLFIGCTCPSYDNTFMGILVDCINDLSSTKAIELIYDDYCIGADPRMKTTDKLVSEIPELYSFLSGQSAPSVETTTESVNKEFWKKYNKINEIINRNYSNNRI